MNQKKIKVVLCAERIFKSSFV